MTVIGKARVNTTDQDLAIQETALRSASCEVAAALSAALPPSPKVRKFTAVEMRLPELSTFLPRERMTLRPCSESSFSPPTATPSNCVGSPMVTEANATAHVVQNEASNRVQNDDALSSEAAEIALIPRKPQLSRPGALRLFSATCLS